MLEKHLYMNLEMKKIEKNMDFIEPTILKVNGILSFSICSYLNDKKVYYKIIKEKIEEFWQIKTMKGESFLGFEFLSDDLFKTIESFLLFAKNKDWPEEEELFLS